MRGGKIVEYKRKILGLLLFLTVSFIVLFTGNNTFVSNLMFLILNLTTIVVLYSENDFILYANYLIVTFFLFVLFVMVSLVWAEDVFRSGERGMTLLKLGINNLLLYNILKKYNVGNYLLWGIIFAAFINQLLGLHIISLGSGNATSLRFLGTMGNPNGVAVLMIFSLFASMVFLSRKISFLQTVYHFSNIILSMYTILLTASKKGIIFGFFIIMIYILSSFRSTKQFFKLALFIFFGGIIFYNTVDRSSIMVGFDMTRQRFEQFSRDLDHVSNDNTTKSSTEMRKYYIEEGFSMLRQRPLFGWGMDSFSIFHGHYSHCNYTEVLLGSGLIGGLLYFSIYFVLLIRILLMKSSTLVFYLVSFVIFLLLLGLAMVDYYDKLNLIILVYLSYVAESNPKESKVPLIKEIG